MKVAELSGALLDYWVAQAKGDDFIKYREDGWFRPSSDWSQGGPLLERALISVLHNPVDSPGAPGYWSAFIRPSDDDSIDGPTYLVAGMRAYVASKFGDEVEDPTQPASEGQR